jgi:5-hydroxyisourate hydrolase-like protein (transthyretin family)
MNRQSYRAIATLVVALLLPGCAAKIHGTVQLMDRDLQTAAGDGLDGTVVNLINTTAAVEQASHSVTTDTQGRFESVKDRVRPGMYKVEVSRWGYETETQTIEVGRFTQKKVELKLKKIQEGKRKTIKGSKSDEDKIINPGEVNIQPPTM